MGHEQTQPHERRASNRARGILLQAKRLFQSNVQSQHHACMQVKPLPMQKHLLQWPPKTQVAHHSSPEHLEAKRNQLLLCRTLAHKFV
jgi:hypothetical protein